MLRVVARADLAEGGQLLSLLRTLVAAPRDDGHAPVLIIPDVFGPSFCRHLIKVHEESGGVPSGFMRDVDGKTVGILDNSYKRRADFVISDEVLPSQIQLRLMRRLVPMIERAFAFRPTRIERYLVASYNGDGEGGFFRAHGDNASAGTAHRRFATSINLNSEDYEGGELIFPEFGVRRYRGSTGGAIVFGCGLLHEALPVTRGRRYAFLPFFYDEAGAQSREVTARSGKVDGDNAEYRA